MHRTRVCVRMCSHPPQRKRKEMRAHKYSSTPRDHQSISRPPREAIETFYAPTKPFVNTFSRNIQHSHRGNISRYRKQNNNINKLSGLFEKIRLLHPKGCKVRNVFGGWCTESRVETSRRP